MQATHDTVVLTPPKPPGMLRALVLALIAHALLLAGLTWGVHWKQSESPAVEAEIWSSVTQQAAPRAVEPPTPTPIPAPQPPPQPQPEPPAPVPTPIPKVTPPPPAPVVRDADIALEREKKRREQEKQRLEEQQEEKREQAKKLAADKKKQDLKEKELEAKREAQAAAEAKRKAVDAADAKRKADAAQAQKAQEKAQDQKAKEQAAQQQKQADALRQENLKRMQGMAGASGAANATGNALQSSGPSSSYGGRVKARVVPNIVFPDDVAGNPMVDVEVRSSPDGTIVGRKIVKSSGVKSWDDAVLKAIDKTETMPRDADGRVPSPLIVGFSPKG